MPNSYHDSTDPSRFLSADLTTASSAQDSHTQYHARYHSSQGRSRPGPPLSPHARNRATPSPTPLPRTSSLLPPPHFVQSVRVQPDLDASGPRSNAFAKPVVSSTTDHHHLSAPRRSHSRSSSAGPSNEPNRLLNRLSASTSSSKNSSAHRRSARSAHRLSVDAGTWREHSNPPQIDQSPRKLRKNPRRSTSVDAAALFAQEILPRPQPATRDDAVHVGLPPLETFSSLQDSIQEDFAPLRSAWNGSPAGPSTKRTQDPPQVSAALEPTLESRMWQGSMEPEVPSMSYELETEPGLTRGHSRNRSQTAKGSTDSSSSRSRDKSGKAPSQKAMLSRALQRANTAVQLDNAHNFEGARQSYAEACHLLAQVLLRTSTDEDKRKLEAIVSCASLSKQGHGSHLRRDKPTPVGSMNLIRWARHRWQTTRLCQPGQRAWACNQDP